jgi:hypothetical protein
VVNLWLLAISLGFNGRHGLLGVAVERQLEGRAIIGIGVAETTNDDARIDWARQGEELDGQVFLGLEIC